MKYDLTSCIIVENNKIYHVGVREDPEEDFKTEVSVSEALKILQDKMDLNAVKFAERFSIPAATYNQWVAGRRNPPLYVIDMLAVAVEKEILMLMPQIEKRSNGNVFEADIIKLCTEMGYPVYIGENNVKVVSSVDELGNRNYYLTACSIHPTEVGTVREWLEKDYD